MHISHDVSLDYRHFYEMQDLKTQIKDRLLRNANNLQKQLIDNFAIIIK